MGLMSYEGTKELPNTKNMGLEFVGNLSDALPVFEAIGSLKVKRWMRPFEYQIGGRSFF